jgi:hypothetical protein
MDGFQPSISSIVEIYAALNSSFIAVFATLEATADGLNPLAISQPPRIISCTAMGAARGM